MKFSDFETLTAGDFFNVMKPLKRNRILRNYVDVAFDSEYQIEYGGWNEQKGVREIKKSTCISLQFALSQNVKTVYYPLKPKVTWRELLDYTLDFFRKHEIKVPATSSGSCNIYYVVFYGYAELSQVANFRDVETDIQLYSNKAVSVKRKIEVGDVKYVVHLIDLRGFFKGSLAKLAKTVGAEKLEIEADGKDHRYWITRMLELYEKHPRIFERYALRDVEVTIKVWNKLKEEALKSGLDPHVYRTLAGLAMAEFRLNYMKNYPCRHRTVYASYARKNSEDEIRKTGEEYKIRRKKRVVYDGDWNVRRFGCLSYAGGNNQAFVRGYMQNLHAKFYDFISLYITATMIQPLPNEFTRWKKLALRDVESHEGFAHVKFKFPENEKYPSLPIQLNILTKLMFPLEGESWCTLSELRQALKHNVKILDFKGYGFYPSENEINHDLKPYFDKLLTKKNVLKTSGKKGTEYAVVKAKLVDTVGKLMPRSKKYSYKKIGKFIKKMETPKAFRKIAKTKLGRQMYEYRGRVGSTWTPEWASLILGNARACADEVLHTPNANPLFISTDGGVWDAEPHFNRDPPPLLKRMMRVGGGIHPEGEGDGSVDELWIARNRLYCTWHCGEVVKFARMGCALREEEFEIFIRESLRNGEPVKKKQRVKY